jgi:hypothetical protein
MARAQKKLGNNPTIMQEQQEREQVMAPPQKKRASKRQVDNEDTTMPDDGAEDATLPENALKPPAKKKGPATNVNKTAKKPKANPNILNPYS